MQEIRSLKVRFDAPISASELEYFRAAIIEKVGREHEWYHNHNNTPEQALHYHYRYPKIQYYRHRQQPVILFIDEVVGEARHFFMQQDWSLQLKDRPYDARLADMRAQQQAVGVTPQLRHYRLSNWLALNEANHAKYLALDRLTEKIELLEGILTSQIVALGRGLKISMDAPIQLDITDWEPARRILYKKIKMLRFDLVFRTNVALPPGFGLGKGSSIGHGRIWPFKNESPTTAHE